MSDSEHTAVGQALGYAYQFDRATYRLLEADNAVVSVGLEHIDDVSVHRADSTSIREQNKATTNDDGRPLTDRSVAVWKTLAIWAEAVLADPGLLGSTEFHLVTNGEVAPDSLAARIHAAKSAIETEVVATELLTMARICDRIFSHSPRRFGLSRLCFSGPLLVRSSYWIGFQLLSVAISINSRRCASLASFSARLFSITRRDGSGGPYSNRLDKVSPR